MACSTMSYGNFQEKAFYFLPCVTLHLSTIHILYQLWGSISSPSILIQEPMQQ